MIGSKQHVLCGMKQTESDETKWEWDSALCHRLLSTSTLCPASLVRSKQEQTQFTVSFRSCLNESRRTTRGRKRNFTETSIGFPSIFYSPVTVLTSVFGSSRNHPAPLPTEVKWRESRRRKGGRHDQKPNYRTPTWIFVQQGCHVFPNMGRMARCI